MRFSKYMIFVVSLISMIATFGCGGSGGGDGSGSSTGTVTMSITDAKPVLPELSDKEITNVFVTIDEVLVHKSGGGWEPLGLPNSPTPFTIDLLQYNAGTTTELVPPVRIESGKYTQIRLSVTDAFLRFHDLISDKIEDVTITIPSENLKTDKNFDFTVPVEENGTGNEKAAVDITIDFDLSKSLVLEGADYKLKPVLHIVDTEVAATIEGTITNSLIDGKAVIRVTDMTIGEVYTTVEVEKDDPTTYSIFWLVPDHDYLVEIDYDPLTDKTFPFFDAQKTVQASEFGPDKTVTVDFP